MEGTEALFLLLTSSNSSRISDAPPKRREGPVAQTLPVPHLRVGPAGAISADQIEGFGHPVIRRGVQELRSVPSFVFDRLDLNMAHVADGGGWIVAPLDLDPRGPTGAPLSHEPGETYPEA